jgi:hypothetical protein
MIHKFLNKKCQIDFKNGCVIVGTVKDVDENGILLGTWQNATYIDWSKIDKIKILKEVN